MFDKEIFKDVKYYVADLDGTVYLGNELIDGAKEFFDLVKENGKDFYFLTNNSSNNSKVCLEKLVKMNFPVPEEKIIISTHVAINYIKKNYPGKSVYLIGNSRLRVLLSPRTCPTLLYSVLMTLSTTKKSVRAVII